MTSSDNSNKSSQELTNSSPCDGCKRHHIKCPKLINSKTCKNFIRKGIPCTYLITRRRRGPKTKAETMVKYLEAINSNNLLSDQSEVDFKPPIIGSNINLLESDKFNQIHSFHQYYHQQQQYIQEAFNFDQIRLSSQQLLVYPYIDNNLQIENFSPDLIYNLSNPIINNYNNEEF